MGKLNSREIGGYFGFSLPNLNQFPYPNALTYNSARSAFYDLLSQYHIKKIWIPKFICNSMLEPLEAMKVEVLFYDLNADFSPRISSLLKKDEFLLYINYFGICTSIQNKLLEIYPSDQIIFDHSQAFFVSPFNCLATIYSPRKFLPLAEGGLLVSNVIEHSKYLQKRKTLEVFKQYEHCFIRTQSTAKLGYEVFKRNESQFSSCIPMNMSEITKELIYSFDYRNIQKKRLNNFKYLHSKLKDINQLDINIDEIESPLTYPLMLKRNYSDLLSRNNIFSPIYWIDSIERIDSKSFEDALVNSTTHLICDQRYTKKHMDIQINKIKEFTDESKR